MPTTAMAKWLTHKVFGQPFASQRQARRQDLAAGGQKPEGGAKNQKGVAHFLNTVLDVCSN